METPDKDSNMPAAETAAMAVMIRWHTSSWCHRHPGGRGTRGTFEVHMGQTWDGYRCSTYP